MCPRSHKEMHTFMNKQAHSQPLAPALMILYPCTSTLLSTSKPLLSICCEWSKDTLKRYQHSLHLSNQSNPIATALKMIKTTTSVVHHRFSLLSSQTSYPVASALKLTQTPTSTLLHQFSLLSHHHSSPVVTTVT